MIALVRQVTVVRVENVLIVVQDIAAGVAKALQKIVYVAGEIRAHVDAVHLYVQHVENVLNIVVDIRHIRNVLVARGMQILVDVHLVDALHVDYAQSIADGHSGSETGTKCSCCGAISCKTCSSSYCSTCNKCLVHCQGHVCATCKGAGGWYETCSNCGGTGSITSTSTCSYCSGGTISYTCPPTGGATYPYGPGRPIYDGCGGDGYFVRWCRTCWGKALTDGVDCSACNGSGYADPPTVQCTKCNGTGTVTESCQNCGGDGKVTTSTKCSSCSNGKQWKDCPDC